MKLNCKPGDLAVIVGADSLKENIGGLVEVIEWVVGRSEPTWRVKTLQKLRRMDWYSGPSVFDTRFSSFPDLYI